MLGDIHALRSICRWEAARQRAEKLNLTLKAEARQERFEIATETDADAVFTPQSGVMDHFELVLRAADGSEVAKGGDLTFIMGVIVGLEYAAVRALDTMRRKVT